jgi:hypothetical protein
LVEHIGKIVDGRDLLRRRNARREQEQPDSQCETQRHSDTRLHAMVMPI